MLQAVWREETQTAAQCDCILVPHHNEHTHQHIIHTHQHGQQSCKQCDERRHRRQHRVTVFLHHTTGHGCLGDDVRRQQLQLQAYKIKGQIGRYHQGKITSWLDRTGKQNLGHDMWTKSSAKVHNLIHQVADLSLIQAIKTVQASNKYLLFHFIKCPSDH